MALPVARCVCAVLSFGVWGVRSFTGRAEVWVAGLEAEGAEQGQQLLLFVSLSTRHPDIDLPVPAQQRQPNADPSRSAA